MGEHRHRQPITWIFIPIAIVLLFTSTHCLGTHCGSPPIPRNARIVSKETNWTTGSTVQFACDPGYEQFGPEKLICLEAGLWSSDLPFCAVNVAFRKPANQSTTSRGADANNANNGNTSPLHDGKYCSETRKEVSPWWRVDLLKPYEIRAIRIFTQVGGQERVQDLEVRVGNSTTIGRNRLCAWHPGTLDGNGKNDLMCARSSIGRYVSLQMSGVEGAMLLCEVQIFTTDEISPARCGLASSSENIRSFESTCFDFQLSKGSDFQGARRYCQTKTGGDLVHDINNITKHFLVSELDLLKPTMTTQLVWIGATKEPGLISRVWHWVGGGAVAKPMWGPDQPNNYNGEQNCVVLDGGRSWLWNDVGCNLNYLPWVCQYGPPSCGSPDKAANATMKVVNIGVNKTAEYSIGRILQYECPPGAIVVGNATRVCQVNGMWSGNAPICKYVDCGIPKTIENGQVALEGNRTSFNATAKYSCNGNFTLTKGSTVRRCQSNSQWDGDAPTCQFIFCDQPEVPINASLSLSNKTYAGSVANYSCAAGNLLIGMSERVCQYGGNWSGLPPMCKFIQCGPLRSIPNGLTILPYNSSIYGSEVLYLCREGHILKGQQKRRCSENGRWSDEEPECELITCGQPDVRPGSYVVADGFVLNAVVEYFCDPGHVMEGSSNRTCQENGRWSGEAPRCRFIECGHVQPVLHGQVDYINFTTHLNSIVSYSCIPGYQLSGNGTRICESPGKWSGSTPFCEEIRCKEPHRPPNSVLSASGNDRSGDGDTFKVGSSVLFRCEKGHRIHGQTVLVCERDGIWSGEPPVCQYVDCLFPEPIAFGEVILVSNTTYFGSTAEYICDDRYETIGAAKRHCQENGTWEGNPPKCQEISCGIPDKPPSVLNIEVGNYTADHVAIYVCSTGQRVTGNNTRICLRNGRWSGIAPTCEWVDCGRPSSPQNGEIYLLNQSTTYLSVMEYHCFFGYKLVGPAIRTCKEDGQWSGVNAQCQLDTSNNDVLGGNSLTKPVASAGDESEGDIVMSKTIGVAIGVGAGGVLLLAIVVALVYLKLRRPKSSISPEETLQVQNGVRTNGNIDDRPIAAYANMETDLSNGSTPIINGEHRIVKPSVPPPLPPNPPRPR
ncbi:hypothetical protein CHUAL_009120 [Chamberlinius hualienensis]